MAILKCHPHLKAVVVDRAQTIGHAADFWRAQPGSDTARALAHMRFEVGDVFTSVPQAKSSRDVYLLSAVLHGFDDASSVQALRTVARAAVNARAANGSRCLYRPVCICKRSCIWLRLARCWCSGRLRLAEYSR